MTAPAEGWIISSPGEQVQVQVRLVAGNRPHYRVLNGEARAEILGWSPLGVVRDDDDFTRELTFTGEAARAVVAEYTLPHGKRRQFVNRGNERVLSFRTKRGARMDIELRAFDDGFGFRYRFPDNDTHPRTILSEATAFQLPAGTRASLSIYGASRGGFAYETPFLIDLPAGAPSPVAGGWSFPALFRTREGRYLLLTEAGLDGSYCGSHLSAAAEGGPYTIQFPLADEAGGRGGASPSSPLPWITPWRIGITGENANTLIESSLVTDFAEPSRLTDTSWIAPGRASWSWWSDGASPRSYRRLATFVDLAATFRWEYSLADAGWPEMQGGGWDALARYAASKNVGLWLWYDSGARGTKTTPLLLPESRRAELARIAATGVRGIKVDYFESDKQSIIQLYLAILEEAARNHLMVDFHGSTLPRGWERTYPNLMTMESVRGAEHYRFTPAFAQEAPAQNTVLVFTRNVVGPMDYTPVTFTRAKHPHRTTWSHELALSVVFESGVQHFADSAESYLALDEDQRDFLSRVPAAWDETHLVEGEPGKLAVVSRRHERTWYVAGINGEALAKRVTIPLDFLGTGTFDMVILADGKTDDTFLVTKRQRNATDTQAIELRPNGGFSMRLVPLE